MNKAYFFSDVHLGMSSSKSERIKEKRLLAFLDHVAADADYVFIVGDLFDFWFEYRTVIPRGYTRVLSALHNLRELGKEMHYIAGNHDFWMRDYLSKELDIQVHFDALEIALGEKRFYIHHGDGIAKHDKGYRLLKRVFRNPVSIFLYSVIHPDLGIPLAKWVSNLSRNHTGRQGPPDDRDYRELAQQQFLEGFDYVIFGHLHTPNLQTFGKKVYVNLGDWIEHFTYAVFDGQNMHLEKWK